MINGNVYYLFSDAICRESKSNFVGAQSNSVAIVMDPKSPLSSASTSVQPDGMVKPLVSLTHKERHLQVGSNGRVTLQAIGCVLESSPGVG